MSTKKVTAAVFSELLNDSMYQAEKAQWAKAESAHQNRNRKERKAKRKLGSFLPSKMMSSSNNYDRNYYNNNYDGDFGGDHLDFRAPANALVSPATGANALASSTATKQRVDVGANEFLRLLRKANEPEDLTAPVQNYLISSVEYSAIASNRWDDGIEFSIVIHVAILTPQWTYVQLLPTKIAVLDVALSMVGAHHHHSDSSSSLPTTTTTTTSTTSSSSSSSSSSTLDDTACAGIIGANDGAHCLIARDAGEYVVRIRAQCPFQSQRARGIVFSVPYAVKNLLDFTVRSPNAEIIVYPCLSPQTTSVPAAAGSSAASWTKLSCEVPTTSEISVQWNEKASVELDEDDSEAVADEVTIAKEVIVTTEQQTIHSIGEGTIVTETEYLFHLSHGSRMMFEFLIPNQLRILNVDGKSIKRWDVVGCDIASGADDAVAAAAVSLALAPDHSTNSIGQSSTSTVPAGAAVAADEATTHNAAASGSMQHRMLKVWLDYGVEETYELRISAEREMSATSGVVTMPRLQALGVSRERGFIGIEARTNVELTDVSSVGLGRMGTSELPARLYQRALNPLLMGYKFLQGPETTLTLEVKKHDDVSVLVTTISRAHIINTITDGKVLHQVILSIGNTQAQYIRVTVPKSATIWTASVAGAAVKPALDADGRVMVPLQSSSDEFSLELVYMTPLTNSRGDTIHGRGRLTFDVAPKFEIPINQLFVTVYLPDNFKYSEFRGAIKEVSWFTGTPPTSAVASSIAYGSYASPMPPSRPAGESLFRGAGVVPVQATIPTSNTAFYFEQLLVIEQDFVVRVDYKEKHKGFFQRRRIGFFN